ncbi:unnamed protein product [Tilletia laevis]|uniref:Transcription factor Iwr1 domain-containing protein n=2 Tax=Tilletia TaxID=13289 RepID=A0A177UPU7_9BASI|nr:hypothetical protein CF336_g1421 [Tilletia laevis]KAE8264090.1 hypothetical protein A4X03_0g1198 [Tilletia caries]CAD6942488.1 unnamed protein product [Tilletia controversa]CAD6893255.1 unnamed protein product [Tilletia caries]CAD6921447.1 unnamed protein product [Tilletia caries]
MSAPHDAATISFSTLQPRSDRDRPRLSRRRERAEEEDDENEDEDARVLSGQVNGSRDAAAVAPQGRSQHRAVGKHDQQEQEPARKRRKKRPTTGNAAQERLSLLGGPAAPGPWVVADGQRSAVQTSSRRLAKLPKSSSNAAGLMDVAAMEAEGVDRQFADMLSEYLKMDETMEDAPTSTAHPTNSSHGDSSNVPARSTITSSSNWQARAPKERIIPGMGPRSAMQNGSKADFSSSGYRDANGDAASDHSSDWEDEKKETADESGDDSSNPDLDRQGGDEDSNSEGFYQNDYPEGQDDDDEAGWDSDEDDEDEGEASDQYGDEDD